LDKRHQLAMLSRLPCQCRTQKCQTLSTTSWTFQKTVLTPIQTLQNLQHTTSH